MATNLLQNAENLLNKIVGNEAQENDKYNMGKILFSTLSRFQNSPHQIDVITGHTETHGSVLKRVVQFVKVITKLGIKKGDVIGITGPNNMDITIPLFGSFVIGAIPFPMDVNMQAEDFKPVLKFSQPKIIFCQENKTKALKCALSEIELNASLYSFGDSGDPTVTTFQDLMKYDTTKIEFKFAEIDPVQDGALIICTSGSTGVPKGVLITHKALSLRLANTWSRFSHLSDGKMMICLISQLHWISAMFCLGAVFVFGATRLQSIQPITAELLLKIINNYNIKMLLTGTPLAMSLTKHPNFEKTDFSKLQYFLMGGSDVPKEIAEALQNKIPNGCVQNSYGMTEALGLILKHEDSKHSTNLSSVGKKVHDINVKIVDIETRQEVGPHQPGEILIQSDVLFKEYYKNPTETKESFENGWFKTGDLLYYDEDGYFYFIERIKMMLKYENHHVSPQELEGAIITHPGVQEVGVTGIKVPGRGDLPIAFIVQRKGKSISKDDIINIVKEKLSPYKQLRGGVEFVDSLPLTASGKINRVALRKMAQAIKVHDNSHNGIM